MSLLFVYGTLQRHQRNNWRLFGSGFIGTARVRGHLYQFRGPGMNFPLFRAGSTDIVQGEIYEVSRGVLDIQDWHELLYKRRKILAFTLNQGPLSCWIYEGLDCLPYNWARKLKTGMWPDV